MISEYVGSNRKYRLRPWVKCVAVGLCAVLAAGLFNTKLTPKGADVAQADVGTAQVRNVNLGTVGINNPDEPADQNQKWSGSYVYFGVYDGKPVKFRVLDTMTQEYNADGDNSTYTMLLDCDNVFEERIYTNDIGWETSDLKCYLNSGNMVYDGNLTDYTDTGFLTNAFTLIERNAIAKSTKAEADHKHYLTYQPLTGEKIFVLDATEVERYGYVGNSNPSPSRIKMSTDNTTAKSWWLRSLKEGRGNGMVSGSDTSVPGAIGTTVANMEYAGYSPALNIDLSLLAFVTASGSQKAATFEATTAAEGNDSWNITLKDSDGFKAERKSSSSQNGEIAKGSKITVSVTDVPKASDGSDYAQISAMLTDAAGTVLAYGKVADKAETGDIEITIPVDMEEGKYSLKVFAETVRSSADANLTDYATNMADISLLIISDIDKVAVTGVTAPKASEELDKSAMCADSRVVTTTLGWKSGDEDVNGKADYGKVYTACATLTPTEGYAFTESTTATINGIEAAYTKLNSDGTLTVAYTFPETEQEPVVIPPVIKLAVNVPEFEEVLFGYGNPSAKVINITNIGSAAADIQSVAIDNTEAFEILGNGTAVNVGETLDTWTVQPKSGLSSGTYTGTITVTYNEQMTAVANVTFTVKKGIMETPDITIDYINEELWGFETGGVYKINGKTAEVTYTKASESNNTDVTVGKVAIDEGWFGTELSIIREAQNDNYTDSEAYLLNVPKRPEAPKVTGTDESIYGHNDGSISGTNADMEYRFTLPPELPVEWTDCKGLSVDKLSPGIYEVRVKAAETSFAGVSALVEIKAGVYTGTINIIGGEGGGTYATGSVITIKATEAPEGMVFKGWSVVLGTVELADIKNPSTTLIVPVGEVQIKAEYEAKQEDSAIKGDITENVENVGNEGNEAPSTGDNVPVVWLLSIMLVSGGVIIGVEKKRLLGK